MRLRSSTIAHGTCGGNAVESACGDGNAAVPQHKRQILEDGRRQGKAAQFFDGLFDVIYGRFEAQFPVLPNRVADLRSAMLWLPDTSRIDHRASSKKAAERYVRVADEFDVDGRSNFIGQPQR